MRNKRWGCKVNSFVEKYGLYVAWSVSLVATGGSLFFSEVLHWIPCELCWFQRIFMYPQVVLLGIAVLKNDKKIWPYSFVLSVMGLCFSIYHYLVQHVPALAPYTPCGTTGVPCETTYINNLFGFITIPFLAGLAFLLTGICMYFVGYSLRSDKSALVNHSDSSLATM